MGRLEGIRDDKLDLTVGGGFRIHEAKGVEGGDLTAPLTVLGPSVPFAVL